MLIWISINVHLATRPFDPYPFILLNLLLSTIAALQAPVILMSQIRKEDKDRKPAISDYLLNLKSEIEIRTCLKFQKVQGDLMEEIKAALHTASKNKSI